MLSSEFNQEMGALIRRLEKRVNLEPELRARGGDADDPLVHLERTIVSLIVLYLDLQQANKTPGQ